MAVRFQLRRQTSILLALALCATVLLGCGESEQIHSYSAPKELKPVASQSAATPKTGEPTDRMLAAILPLGNQAYFFKVVGPVAQIEAREKDLRKFFTNIKLGDDGKPKWQLPADWKDQAGGPMRLATIVVPAETKPLEISVTALPWGGARDDLLRNVNRWRGQLQLTPITARQLGEDTEETKAGDQPITIVDLRGHFASSGMSPPFAGAAAPTGRDNGPSSDLPAGHPPLDASTLPPGHPDIGTAAPPHDSASQPSRSVADVQTPKFTAPADWRALPAGGLRKAAFAVGDEKHGATVTLINFPAQEGPMIADPLQNANRWRGEVGLNPVKPDELAKVTESIAVDGQTATYVPAIPDASKTQSNLAELAAMIKNGDQIWFLKLKGDRDVVVAQETAFKTFLKSLHFGGDTETTDGHK